MVTLGIGLDVKCVLLSTYIKASRPSKPLGSQFVHLVDVRGIRQAVTAWYAQLCHRVDIVCKNILMSFVNCQNYPYI